MGISRMALPAVRIQVSAIFATLLSRARRDAQSEPYDIHAKRPGLTGYGMEKTCLTRPAGFQETYVPTISSFLGRTCRVGRCAGPTDRSPFDGYKKPPLAAFQRRSATGPNHVPSKRRCQIAPLRARSAGVVKSYS